MKSITIQVARKVYPHAKKVFGLLTLTLFLFSSFLILIQNAEAQQLVCPERVIQQVTNATSGESRNASINADGTWVAFTSFANINGGNPDGNREIYLYNSRAQTITQITDTTGGGGANNDPSISADGSLIAFNSRANINGGNPDGNNEIYLANVTSGAFTQITDTTQIGSDNLEPSINGTGTLIAFRSDADVNGTNPDGNTEIYLANVTLGTITQITDTIGGGSANRDPSISADGMWIAFRSNRNITGGNPLNLTQVFLANTTTGIITQITNITSGGTFSASINGDGSLIAFYSQANITGGNPEGNSEVYLAHITTGIIEQITNEPSGNAGDLSISADGLRIAFETGANINGQNPDGNREIFIFDFVSNTFTQITNEPAGPDDNSEDPSVNADGTYIAFRSEANINGGNPTGNQQIYVATCFTPEPIPTLSEWGLVAMAGVLGLVGFMVLRRRKVTA